MLTAIVYGVTFAFIAGAYTGEDIASAFIASASVFIVMAILGTVTKRDLSRIGSYASAALIGLIVAMLINLFLKNPTIDYIFLLLQLLFYYFNCLGCSKNEEYLFTIWRRNFSQWSCCFRSTSIVFRLC